jgi:hypothetical protein
MMTNELSDAKMWVVLPINWEYDDNYYNRQGFDTPNACFTIKEMADEMAKEKNIQDFKSIATESGFGGYYHIHWGNEESLKLLKERYNISEDLCLTQETLGKMSDDAILELMSSIGLIFYKVAELKIYC